MANEQHDDAPGMMGTRPVKQHEWLQNLVGKWRVETEMWMRPDQPPIQSTGTEVVSSLGDLWAIGEGEGTTPDGQSMSYRNGLGYDVSFKEYRGFWLADQSSHLWKYVGELSVDGRVMTLSCEGPHMEKDGETAHHKDVIEIIDTDHRTMTSYGQDDAGNWQKFVKATFTRV